VLLDWFQLTLQAIRTDVELVAQQAIEFWSTICDEEIIILDEAEEAKQYKQQAPRQCLYYIKGAANYLVPVLTEAMTKGVCQSTQHFAVNKLLCLVFFSTVMLFTITELMNSQSNGNIQDKSTDAQQWNIAMAAGSCLNLIAITIGDDVVPPAMNFILTHWNSQVTTHTHTLSLSLILSLLSFTFFFCFLLFGMNQMNLKLLL
jgi:importin subunit beta-1